MYKKSNQKTQLSVKQTNKRISASRFHNGGKEILEEHNKIHEKDKKGLI